MRNIKVRFWDLENKKWSPWSWEFLLKNGLLDKYDAQNYVLQQFTGLLDKNNVEVFEGDIVRQAFDMRDDPNSYVEDIQWSNKLNEVYWDEGRYGFKLRQINSRYNTPPTSHLPLLHESQYIEVLGNVFEGIKNETVRD